MTVTIVDVRREIVVDAPIERAFEVFTAGMDTWWPLESHHIGEQAVARLVMEPRAGGRWYEEAADGTQTDWGRVLAWEPPGRLLLAWHLNADWEWDPDPDKSTEVEIMFTTELDGRTRLQLEHRKLERYGDRAAEVREAVDSPNGWQGLLSSFAEVARA